MITVRTGEPDSWLSRAAVAHSRRSGRRVGAVRVGADEPVFFMADEVIIDAADDDLIGVMLDAGGRITRADRDGALPEEFRRAGLGRREPPDTTDLPRSVRIQFDRVPEVPTTRLVTLLDERADFDADSLEFSSPQAAGIAALISPMIADGRGIWLNPVGVDDTLPLRTATEGGGLEFSAHPLSWPAFTGPSRIADAWQLVESMRIEGSVSPVVFLCVCDSGFWFNATSTAANTPEDHMLADLGTGLLRWNAVTDTPGVPAGPGRKRWHGTLVASAAAAALGNRRGAAGSGGSVARVCYFYADRSADSALVTMIRCTQWGIPFVVYSGGFRAVDPLFGLGAWSRTFNWAADNGTMMFASAGNNHIHVDNTLRWPTTGTPRVLTIGALNTDGTEASFSNWGTSVGLWAPGVDIPVVPVPDPAPYSLDGQLADGTSFSTPIVAGVAAMMRAVNPALSVDQIRHMLVNTGWGGDGHVSRGLDAYAAVWAAMADRMAEDALDPVDERLYPTADGRFQPIFNKVINHGGDVDTFLLDVPAFSTVVVDLQWYEGLAAIDLRLENTDPDAAAPEVTLREVPGRSTLTAAVGSGTYRIELRGDGPTAYLLRGRRTAGRLAPDRFEGNNSFDSATLLQVQANPRPWLDAGLFGAHGPGTFVLNLHTAATAPATTDRDFFRVDVPADLGALRIPQIVIGSDELVDVALFDQTRTLIAEWRGARSHTVALPKGRTSYVRVSGTVHTRYSLWVGLGLNLGALRKQWQEELRVIPDWWVVPPEHPEWVIHPEELRAVVLGEQTIADATLLFRTASKTPTPVRLELLRDDGEVVGATEFAQGAASFEIANLDPGPYVLRITSDASRSQPLLFTAAAPQAPNGSR